MGCFVIVMIKKKVGMKAGYALSSFSDLVTRSDREFRTFSGIGLSSLSAMIWEIILHSTKIACLCSAFVL